MITEYPLNITPQSQPLIHNVKTVVAPLSSCTQNFTIRPPIQNNGSHPNSYIPSGGQSTSGFSPNFVPYYTGPPWMWPPPPWVNQNSSLITRDSPYKVCFKSGNVETILHNPTVSFFNMKSFATTLTRSLACLPLSLGTLIITLRNCVLN